MTTAALELRTAFLFVLVLSLALVLVVLLLDVCCVSRTRRRCPLVLLSLTLAGLAGLAAMTVSLLSSFPRSVSSWQNQEVNHR